MADEQTQEPRKGPMPPYIAFKTLSDIVERMEADGVPTRVDATWLDNYAGGYRATVIGNLQTMGLLKKTGEPEQVLLSLVAADEGGRKKLVAELFRAIYADVLALPLNSTQGEFLEVFTKRGAAGDTRRKAISFFLKGCTYAGVEVGKLWKTPPASPTGKRRSAIKDKEIPGKDDALADEQPPPAVKGHTQMVTLKSGGTVTLTYDVNMFEIDDEDEAFVLGLIKKLRRYQSAEKDSLDDSSNQDEDDE